MDFSLELKVNLHICFSSYEYYEKNGHFMTYSILCDYVHKFVKTDVLFEGSPTIVKRIILNIRDYISLIFGFGEETSLEMVLSFFRLKLWELYSKIIIPLKDIYKSITIN